MLAIHSRIVRQWSMSGRESVEVAKGADGLATIIKKGVKLFASAFLAKESVCVLCSFFNHHLVLYYLVMCFLMTKPLKSCKILLLVHIFEPLPQLFYLPHILNYVVEFIFTSALNLFMLIMLFVFFSFLFCCCCLFVCSFFFH